MSNLFQGDILAPLGSSKDLRSVFSISWCICSKDTFGLGHYPIEEYIYIFFGDCIKAYWANQKMVVGSVAVEISLVSVGNLHYDYWIAGCYVVGLSMVYWSVEG